MAKVGISAAAHSARSEPTGTPLAMIAVLLGRAACAASDTSCPPMLSR